MEFSETECWAKMLECEVDPKTWMVLSQRVEEAYRLAEVYPPRQDLFAAFQMTPPEHVRVVIVGQDPYHEPGQAQGLSFSVPDDIPMPKSLVNIYKELSDDLQIPIPKTGCLIPWAEQGVLLLNSVLTVEAHKPGSHRSFGWEYVSDAVIRATNDLPQPIAFLLWGNYAAKKEMLIQTEAPRLVIKSAHPSPLSAYRGFFGSRPFSQINRFLKQYGEIPIHWA